MSTKTTKTIYADKIAVCRAVGKPYRPDKGTTINELYKVAENETPVAGEYPIVKYLMWGVKGTEASNLTDGRTVTNHILKSPTFMGLYGPMPWVIRPVDDDLPPEIRSRYRMRTSLLDKNGKRYIAYYALSVPDNHISEPIIEVRNTKDGVTTTTLFEADPADLTPKPIPISNTNIQNPEGDCLIVSSKLRILLDQNDISEMLNAYRIMYGDTKGATITEIAICSGIDKNIQSGITGTTGMYREAIYLQIAAHLDYASPLNESKTGIDYTVDVGSQELIKI